MPNRYWVSGGSGNWNGTDTNNWSATSGGASGASVPTTADDVFFDANSGAGTATIAAGNTGAKSINCTGFTGTITGTAAITVAGSVTLDAGQTYTHTGTMTFTGTGTLTTAGKTFSGVTVNGSGITLTLGDAFSNNGNFVVNQGGFDTASYTFTVGAFQTGNNSSTKNISFGSSTVNALGGSGATFSIPNAANLTFNAGTSQINVAGDSININGGGQTFYNFTFLPTGSTTRLLIGQNTFNNLTFELNSSGGGRAIGARLGNNQIVNGTFTCAGSSATIRGFIYSDTIGTTRTITAAAVSANDCDFRDITIAGAAAPISPTRAGDCGGNSGITFPAAKTVYRVGTNTFWEGSNSWATTSGGTGSNDNFPLVQDTAVIDNNTALTGTLTLASFYNIGTLDCSARTTGITLNHNAFSTSYGSYILGSGVTVSDIFAQTFSGRGTMTFTSAGKTITFPITVDTPGGTFQLGDAFSSSNTITHTRGTFDANNYNLTCTRFASNNSNVRTITMGSGLWTLTPTGSGGVFTWNVETITNLTFNKDTANILIASATSSLRPIFSGGVLAYNKLTLGGSGVSQTFDLSNNSHFTELASTKTDAYTIRFASNLTVDTWSITGTSGNVVTVNSDTAGSRRTFNLTNVTSGIDYLNVKDIGVNQTDTFYVGTNSTDGGNNLNVIFTDPPSTAATGNMFMLFQ